MRAILRTLVAIALLAVVGFVAFGYWTGAPWLSAITTPAAAGTSGAATGRGAQFGQQAAAAVRQMGNTLDDSAITAKIKAKMTLDDSVRARTIDVSTSGSTVTVGGTVRSAAEHDRVIRLARETDGIAQVVDRLVMLP